MLSSRLQRNCKALATAFQSAHESRTQGSYGHLIVNSWDLVELPHGARRYRRMKPRKSIRSFDTNSIADHAE